MNGVYELGRRKRAIQCTKNSAHKLLQSLRLNTTGEQVFFSPRIRSINLVIPAIESYETSDDTQRRLQLSAAKSVNSALTKDDVLFIRFLSYQCPLLQAFSPLWQKMG